MAKFSIILAGMVLCWVLPLHADATQMYTIAKTLRCLVCQGQTIADSDADFAVDIRSYIQDALAKGMSEAEIIAKLQENYGDSIKQTPKHTHVLLWWIPCVIAIGTGGNALRKILIRLCNADVA